MHCIIEKVEFNGAPRSVNPSFCKLDPNFSRPDHSPSFCEFNPHFSPAAHGPEFCAEHYSHDPLLFCGRNFTEFTQIINKAKQSREYKNLTDPKIVILTDEANKDTIRAMREQGWLLTPCLTARCQHGRNNPNSGTGRVHIQADGHYL